MADNTTRRGGSVITLTFVLALFLTVFPLANWAIDYRPEFVTLVLIYWCMALPRRVNIGIAWIMGLLVDVLTGGLLGEHALSMAIVAFVTTKLHKQIRVYPLWQQALTVCTLVALNQLIVVWVKGITGDSPQSWTYWAPSLTSAILWPWVFGILRAMRRRFRVS